MCRDLLIPNLWAKAGRVFGAFLFFALSVSHGQLGTDTQLPQGILQEGLLEGVGLDALREMAGGEFESSGTEMEFPELMEEEAEINPLQDLLDEQARLNSVIRVAPRLKAQDTIIIEFAPKEDEDCVPVTTTNRGTVCISTLEETEEEIEIRERYANENPFQLDDAGFLYLPGIPRIALSGLNIEETTTRLQAIPQFEPYDLVLTLLPLDPVGTAALEPFGYDLFRGSPTTFAPATDVPVPSEYVMGPGDTIIVQLFGGTNASFPLVVTREGILNFPEIGPITVGGISFDELKTLVTERVQEQLTGVRVSITVGALRSIRIFVLGDAEFPGSYTVSGLSTITNALFLSGGVKEIGSLRKIELKRNGVTLSTLDLYDLLLNGDTSNDARLQPGDVIFVPPIGNTVAVDGMVRRPAIYELIDNESTVIDVIELSGGLIAKADVSAVKLERIIPGRGITVRDIDTNSETDEGERLQDGDVIRVLGNIDQFENVVHLDGNVQQPGPYEWTSGMRLSDLLQGPEFVKPMSDLGYVFVRREPSPNVSVEAVSASLSEAWLNKGGPEDILLQPRDTVHVFNLEQGRTHIIDPLLQELAVENQTIPVVTINGAVFNSGTYPLETDMRISDLIRAGGGLLESAYLLSLEIMRHETRDNMIRESRIFSVNLADILDGDLSEDLFLQPYDTVSIRQVPEWGNDLRSVELEGAVRFPGIYSIRAGETLSTVMERAGGLTERGFAGGAIFLREEIRRREQEQISLMADRLQSSLAVESLSSTATIGSNADSAAGQALVSQLRETEAAGRLVIDLEGILAGDPSSDITLEDGDRLLVPNVPQSVMVIGEVQYASTHVYEENLMRDDYLRLSGGFTSGADKGRIYVLQANGQVQTAAGVEMSWLQRATRFTGSDIGGGVIGPGDTIIVPYKNRLQTLSLWQTSAQVVYQMAVTLTAINSFL